MARAKHTVEELAPRGDSFWQSFGSKASGKVARARIRLVGHVLGGLERADATERRSSHSSSWGDRRRASLTLDSSRRRSTDTSFAPIQVSFFTPNDLIDWLRAETEMTDAEAMTFTQLHAADLASGRGTVAIHQGMAMMVDMGSWPVYAIKPVNPSRRPTADPRNN